MSPRPLWLRLSVPLASGLLAGASPIVKPLLAATTPLPPSSRRALQVIKEVAPAPAPVFSFEEDELDATWSWRAGVNAKGAAAGAIILRPGYVSDADYSEIRLQPHRGWTEMSYRAVAGGKLRISRTQHLPDMSSGQLGLHNANGGPQGLALLWNGELLCRLPGVTGGKLGYSGQGVQLTESRLQPTEPVIFRDDFMRASGPDDTENPGDWDVIAGTWKTSGSLRPREDNQLNPNPFVFRATVPLTATGKIGKPVEARARVGKWFWTDYAVTTAVKPSLEDPQHPLVVGLEAYRQDDGNAVRAEIDFRSGLVTLQEGGPGNHMLIASAQIGGAEADQWHRMRLDPGPGAATVMLDGAVVLRGTTHLAQGTASLYAKVGGENYADFDDVRLSPPSQAEHWGEPALPDRLVKDRLMQFWASNARAWKRDTSGTLWHTGDFFGDITLNMPVPALDPGAGFDVILAGDGSGTTKMIGNTGIPLVGSVVHFARPTDKAELTYSIDGATAGPGFGTVAIPAPDAPPLNLTLTRTAKSQQGAFPQLRFANGGSVAKAIAAGPSSATASTSPKLRPATFVAEAFKQNSHEIQLQLGEAHGFFDEPNVVSDTPGKPGQPIDPNIPIFARTIGIEYSRPAGTKVGVRPMLNGRALPPSSLTRVDLAAKTFERDGRAIIGINITPVNPDLARDIGLPDGLGAIVDAVEEGSPAQRAGVKVGDVIRSVEGKTITNVETLRDAVGSRVPGTPVKFQVVRADGDKSNIDWELVQASTPKVLDYSFTMAPTDWRAAKGEWEVAERWTCSPQWSFFSGKHDANPVLWSRFASKGDWTLEAAIATPMDLARGERSPSDLSVTVGGDGRDLASGYSFQFAANHRSVNMVRRGDAVVVEKPFEMPALAGDTHQDWFYVRIERRQTKEGLRFRYSVNGKEIANYLDEHPLPDGGKLAFWTVNGGLSIARVRLWNSSVTSGGAVPPAAGLTLARTNQTPQAPLMNPLGTWSARSERNQPLANIEAVSLANAKAAPADSSSKSVKPATAPKELPATPGKAIAITNAQSGGDWTVYVTRQPYDIKAHPALSFDYKVNSGVKINLYVKLDDAWREIGFTAPRPNADAGDSAILGAIADVKADDQWHTAKFDLALALAGKSITADKVQALCFAAPATDYLRAGLGGNHLGASYEIRNFQAPSAAPLAVAAAGSPVKYQ